jgi:hypothetical protein
MNVLVRGRAEAGELLQSKNQRVDAVVAIVTPSESIRARYGDPKILIPCPGFEQFQGPKLVLKFDDVEDPEDPAQAVPQLDHMTRFFSWVREAQLTANGTVLIHCTEGRGRSAALAIALRAYLEGEGSEAAVATAVMKDRPIIWPNLLVIKLADQLLGRRGVLHSFWEGWKAQRSTGIYVGG